MSYLKELRTREKVIVEESHNYPNRADQTANIEMTSVIAKFRAGQPLGISARANLQYDQIIKNGEDLSKPIDKSGIIRNLRYDDAMVEHKRLSERIKEAEKTQKAYSVVKDAKASKEPQKAQNEPVKTEGKNEVK